jgi:hypothetical protein
MASVYPILSDGFTGTAGASLTGHVPDTVQDGSMLWTDFTPTFPVLVFATGGAGVTTATGSAGQGFAKYDLTGSPASGTHDIHLTSSDATPDAIIQFRRDAGANNYFSLTLNFANGLASMTKTVAGASSSVLPNTAFTVTTGIDYHIVIVLVTTGGSTTVSLTINGTSFLSGAVVSDATLQSSNLFVIGTDTGTIGALKYTSATYTVDGPSTATLSGPANGVTGSASAAFTVTLGSAVPTGGAGLKLTLADGGGSATFAGTGVSGTTLTIPSGGTTATFTDTRSVDATGNVTVAFTGIAVSGSPISYTTAALPTAFTVTGPATLTVGGGPGTYTFTLNHPAPSGGVSIVPSVTVFSANLSTNPIVIAAGVTTGTTAVTPTSAGTGVVTGTASGLTATPQSVTVSGSTTATGFSLTGPGSGYINVVSTNFTFTPTGGTYSGTITPTMTGLTGSWLPSSLTWAGTAVSQTTQFTPNAVATGSANGTASPALTAPSAVSFVSSPTPTTTTWQTGVVGFASGLIGGTSPGFGYRVGPNGGAFGTLVSTGITEDSPGCYSALFGVAAGSIPRVRWLDGFGADEPDYTPLALPGTGVSGSFPATAPPNWFNRNSVASDLAYDGFCQTGSTSTMIKLDPADPYTQWIPAGAISGASLIIVAGTGTGQSLPLASISGPTGSKVAMLATGNTAAVVPDTTSAYNWKFDSAYNLVNMAGLIRSGETAQATFMKILTTAVGEWDTTSVVGYTVWRMDGVEIFRVPIPTSSGRSQAT